MQENFEAIAHTSKKDSGIGKYCAKVEQNKYLVDAD
jgi:hypothetical protein